MNSFVVTIKNHSDILATSELNMITSSSDTFNKKSKNHISITSSKIAPVTIESKFCLPY